FGMIHPALTFLPLLTNIGTVITAWSVMRCCSGCPMHRPLAKWPHRISGNSVNYTFSERVIVFFYIPLFWVMHAAFNSFTITGLGVATVTLIYSFIGCFLGLPQSIYLLALGLSVTSWIINATIVFATCCEGMQKDFLVIRVNEDGEEESLFY
ncbi:unnamed protein product, partial [Meganyctiphanes norvegica]